MLASGSTPRALRGSVTPTDRYVAAFLDELAPTFDDWEHGLHRRLAERLVDLAGPLPGDDCFDIGASTGIIAELLAARVGPRGQVTSVDVSERMLERARGRTAGNTCFMGMSADDRALRLFRDASFDVVTVGRPLADLVAPHAVMHETLRLLKPGGRTALFCRRHSLATRAERLFFSVLGALASGRPVRPLEQQSRLGEPAVLRGLLYDVGFDVMDTSEMLTGGQARGARAWTGLMMETWPVAHLLIGCLTESARRQFEDRLDTAMRALGDDAYRYHHPHLLMAGIKR